MLDFFKFQVGFDITPTATKPLSEFLQMGLDKHLDELKNVSSQASKEYALEKVSHLLLLHAIHVVKKKSQCLT
jgi:hypothetical protein